MFGAGGGTRFRNSSGDVFHYSYVHYALMNDVKFIRHYLAEPLFHSRLSQVPLPPEFFAPLLGKCFALGFDLSFCGSDWASVLFHLCMDYCWDESMSMNASVTFPVVQILMYEREIR